jgi:hypothetical protein
MEFITLLHSKSFWHALLSTRMWWNYLTYTATYTNVMELLDNPIGYTTVAANEMNCTILTSTTPQVSTSFTVNTCNTRRFCSIWNNWSYILRKTSFEGDKEPVIWWNKNLMETVTSYTRLLLSLCWWNWAIRHMALMWGFGVSDVAIMWR